MKKLIVATMMASLLFSAVAAHADSHGSTFIPPTLVQYKSNNVRNWSNIFLSNITGEEITCTVRIYDHQGVDVTTNYVANVFTGSYTSGDTPSLGASSTFTIPANGTRELQLYTTNVSAMMGYGIIEWSSTNEKIGKALLGSVHRCTVSGTGTFASAYTDINNGNPF